MAYKDKILTLILLSTLCSCIGPDNNAQTIKEWHGKELTKSEGQNTLDEYFLTECYSASNPNVITGMTYKQRNYWDSCSYSMTKGDCDD